MRKQLPEKNLLLIPDANMTLALLLASCSTCEVQAVFSIGALNGVRGGGRRIKNDQSLWIKLQEKVGILEQQRKIGPRLDQSATHRRGLEWSTRIVGTGCRGLSGWRRRSWRILLVYYVKRHFHWGLCRNEILTSRFIADAAPMRYSVH